MSANGGRNLLDLVQPVDHTNVLRIKSSSPSKSLGLGLAGGILGPGYSPSGYIFHEDFSSPTAGPHWPSGGNENFFVTNGSYGW